MDGPSPHHDVGEGPFSCLDSADSLTLRGHIIYHMGEPSFRLKVEPDVQSFIDGLAPVPQRQVARDLEKLA